MKLNTHKALRMGALAAVLALLAQAAPAATFSYHQDDLLLGFSSKTIANEYVINLGQISSLTAGSLSLGNIGTDLVAQFGANWYNSGDLYWGAFAATYTGPVGNDPQYTIYATKRTGLAALTTDVDSAQAGAASKVDSVGNVLNGKTTTANSSFAVVQAKTTANSYTSKQNASRSQTLAVYSYSEASFTNGVTGATLDVYQLQPDTVGDNHAGTKVGTLSIDSSGLIVTSVPEPSTWAMLGISVAGLVLMAVRRGKAVRA
ncbi:MAG: PEP-CTERM sorting domain-containing protein [Verrucomicrobiia bacterium]